MEHSLSSIIIYLWEAGNSVRLSRWHLWEVGGGEGRVRGRGRGGDKAMLDHEGSKPLDLVAIRM